MTRKWKHGISAIACGVLVCIGMFQINVHTNSEELTMEQGQVVGRAKDYKASLGNQGGEKQICQNDIQSAQTVQVTFKGTGGPEQVKVSIYQEKDALKELVGSQVLSLRDSLSVSVDGDSFYVMAEVTEGMGGSATFQVS